MKPFKNLQWAKVKMNFENRKCLITSSKAHEVVTKMTKVEKGGSGAVNMWSLNQNISGLAFVKPNIPALKYGRYENRGSKHFHWIYQRETNGHQIKWLRAIFGWDITICKCKPRQIFAVFMLRKGLCGNQMLLFNKPYKTMLFQYRIFTTFWWKDCVEKVSQIIHTVHAADGCYWNYKKLYSCLNSPWNILMRSIIMIVVLVFNEK